MNARAVPCAVRAINRNIASGCRQPAGSYTRANRACLSHTRSNSQNALNKFRAINPLAQCVVGFIEEYYHVARPHQGLNNVTLFLAPNMNLWPR